MRLENVEQLRDTGSTAEALAAALAAWQESHAPEVADVIDTLTCDGLASLDAPRARKKEQFQNAWLAFADQPGPLVTGWLADNLTRLLRVEADHFGVLDPNYGRRKYAAFFDRLDKLEERAPDPRIARALTRFLVDAPYSAWDRRAARLIYRPVMALLTRCGDPRQLPVLADLLAHPRANRATTREELAESLPDVIAALRAVPVAMGADERAAWRRLGPPTQHPDAASDGDALLEAVHARDGDDAARLVYADWLQERGDERGEFIALQVRDAQGHASEADRRRARALLKTNREQWLGELGLVLTKTEFHRGFLDRAVLAQNAAATPEAWACAPGSAGLRTVQVLEQGRGNAEHYAACVTSPNAINLRRVEIPVASLLETLCAGPPRRIESVVFHRLPNLASLKLLSRCAALPALSHLVVPLEDNQEARLVSMLRESTLLGRLHRLTVQPHWNSSVTSVLRSLKLDLFDGGTLAELAIEVHAGHCVVSRRDGGLHVELEDRWGELATQLLDAVPEARSIDARLIERPDASRALTRLEALQKTIPVRIERFER